MKFPSIRQTAAQSPTIQDLIECVEILTGRRRNREIDYGTIDGVRTKALDIVHLCNMGRIKARAYREAAQSIVAYGHTKVAIDTISFDTEGVVDTTNSRITPSLPGYYQFSAQVFIRVVPDGELVAASIRRNGIVVSGGSCVSNGGAQGAGGSVVSGLIYMNGETDYLELSVYNTHSSALALDVGQPNQNYISIVGPF